MTSEISSLPDRQRFSSRPTTRSGWWAVGLGALFVLMFLINSFVFMPLQVAEPWRQTLLPIYGISMLLCGLLSGVAGLVAILRHGERSWMVWLTLLPGLWVLFMLVGEMLVPH